MSNHAKWNQSAVAALILYPCLSLANPSGTIEQMQKDEWLKSVKVIISEPICKGFMQDASISARLNERQVSYEQCLKIIPQITDQCTEKYYQELPEMINKESAEKWGHIYGRCIGHEFANMYLYLAQSSSR